MSFLDMTAEGTDEERAVIQLIQAVYMFFQKLKPAKIVKIADGRADVEILTKDAFLGEEDGTAQVSEQKLTNVPVFAFGTSLYLSSTPPQVGDEVSIFCFDRSIAAFKDADSADPFVTEDMTLHGYNGAFILPLPLSRLRMEGMDPNKAVFGTRSDKARMECDEAAGDVQIKVNNLVKLAGGTVAAAKADPLDGQLDAIVTRVNILSASVFAFTGNPALADPILIGRPSIAMTKVKGE